MTERPCWACIWSTATGESLLAPRIEAHGFANVMTIEAVLCRRLDARLATATPEEMELVSNALRAAQDL